MEQAGKRLVAERFDSGQVVAERSRHSSRAAQVVQIVRVVVAVDYSSQSSLKPTITDENRLKSGRRSFH